MEASSGTGLLGEANKTLVSQMFFFLKPRLTMLKWGSVGRGSRHRSRRRASCDLKSLAYGA